MKQHLQFTQHDIHPSCLCLLLGRGHLSETILHGCDQPPVGVTQRLYANLHLKHLRNPQLLVAIPGKQDYNPLVISKVE